MDPVICWEAAPSAVRAPEADEQNKNVKEQL